MIAFEETFTEHDPSRVVVYGDINSTLAAAVVAAKLNIPVAHVEAGLRSFDRTMPEEVNRIVTDVLSDLHFVTSPEAVDQLIKEGLPEGGIHFVGNPMIDTLVRFRSQLDPEGLIQTFGVSGAYAVATLHRPSNVDDPVVAVSIVAGLSEVAKHLPIVIALHPRGRRVLEEAGLGSSPGIHVIEPLGYLEFMSLMSGARLVLTDSGGIQEETTILGIPCLTLRDNTERPITITMGTNELVGTESTRIATAAEHALAQPPDASTPPLWDGKAGERIADLLIDAN
jgi:UDP-N-acetylglucosamine 2-epimerase (non-hydrolysing)